MVSNTNTQGEHVRFVVLDIMNLTDFTECRAERAWSGWEIIIPIVKVINDTTRQQRTRVVSIPRKMDLEWIEEMKQLVRNVTELGFRINHQSFVKNILRPNLRKLQVDCGKQDIPFHNEYFFAIQIFSSADEETLSDLAIGFRNSYNPQIN
jgi:hypothetical protein